MSATPTNRPSEVDRAEHQSLSDLGQDLWSHLVGRGATVNYTLKDLTVEVPLDTGPEAPHTTWRLDGTMSVASREQVQTRLRPTKRPLFAGLTLHSDVAFSIDRPPVRGTTPPPLRGTLSGRGGVLNLDFDELPALDWRSGGAGLRTMARYLSLLGLQVAIRDGSALLAVVGTSRPNLFGLLALRSRNVRLSSLGTLLKALRRRGGPTLALADLLPPTTPLPPLPTLLRQRRRVTTTHDPDGGGKPRFYFPGDLNRLPGSQTHEFYLRVGQTTTIGSDPLAHLQLAGLEPFEAEVRRDQWDEYWIVSTGSTPVRVNGAPVAQARMRTGTKVQVGRWTMNYFRAEHADHGRPYGGRIGGEAGHQIPQEMPVYREPRTRG